MGFIDSIVQYYSHINDELSDRRTVDFPLISSPLSIGVLISFYLVVVAYGPKLMDKRPPLKIRCLILVYNVSQIAFNSFLFVSVVNLSYLYFLVKIYDLLDTLFIICNKKSSQLSLLHVYHHTAVVSGMWLAIKYIPTGQAVTLMGLNCFVHIVMYSYYLITVIYPEFRTSPLKKRLTELQIAQFYVALGNLSLMALLPDCNFPLPLVLIGIPLIIILTVLFTQFFKTTYNSDRHRKSK